MVCVNTLAVLKHADFWAFSLSAEPLPCPAPYKGDQVSEGQLSGPAPGYSSPVLPPGRAHFSFMPVDWTME